MSELTSGSKRARSRKRQLVRRLVGSGRGAGAERRRGCVITTYTVGEAGAFSERGFWAIDLVAGDRVAITGRPRDGQAVQVVLLDARGAIAGLCKTPRGECMLRVKVKQSGRYRVRVSDVSGGDAHAAFQLVCERQLPRRQRRRAQPTSREGALAVWLGALRAGMPRRPAVGTTAA